MERNAGIACTLLLLAAATLLPLPAASAAKLVAGKGAATTAAAAAAAAAALVSTVAPWVEDAAVGGMMMVAAAGSVEYGHGEGVVHRRVLQARGGYVNPSLVADRQSCVGSCPARGGSYTGRGNRCIYRNRSC